MKIIEGMEQDYRDWFNKNDDPYGRRCFTYAEDWADIMEQAMDEGMSLEEIADSASHQADTDGITGFMYGMAVSILSKVWVHGERLRQWHNVKTQIGTEGHEADEKGTTLNPALLTVEGKP